MRFVVRVATRADISAMHEVRLSVLENRLTSTAISEADYVPAIETTGRGWVAELEGQIVGFAVGNSTNGNIWALFVRPDHERQGYGRALLDAMVAWLRSQGLNRLWLTTGPGTRAEHFYLAAGWCRSGQTAGGETILEFRGI